MSMCFKKFSRLRKTKNMQESTPSFAEGERGLPTEILKFFSMDVSIFEQGTGNLRTVKDFTDQPKHHTTTNVLEVFKIIAFFKNEGYLISFGNAMHEEILVCFRYDEITARYGTYDFLPYGFSAIAKHFSGSVRPIVIRKTDGSYDIGTGFLLGNFHTLVTARHVIEDAEYIHITAENGTVVQVMEVTFPKDEKVDIAIMTVANYAFIGMPAFNMKEGEILEDILTIGYPPIPGFDAVQIYEKASINNRFKISKGQIVGKDTAYLDGIEYLIMNAKVKGGNSGSPVINKNGNVIGMVVQIPLDSQDTSKLDSLGYGIITPRSEIYKLLQGADNVPEVTKHKVIQVEDGFKIVK